MDFVRLLISWKAYLLSPRTSERRDVLWVKVILCIKCKRQSVTSFLTPLLCFFLFCILFYPLRIAIQDLDFPFPLKDATYTPSPASSIGLHCWSVEKKQWRGKRSSQHHKLSWAAIRTIVQENSIENLILWWMGSIQVKWLCSLYTPFIQTQFSHRPQLLFDLLLWTLCQKWFNFTLWINSTWCSPSHSRLMAKPCIYNTIDNIEQYWWKGRISTSGSGQE